MNVQRGLWTQLAGMQTSEAIRHGFCMLLFAVCLPLCAENTDSTAVAMTDTAAVLRDTTAAVDTTAAPKREIVALKNNLLYDAIATPNLEIEFRLAQHWTLEAGVGFNPFPLNDETFPKWRHVAAWVQPKYWICGAFQRDFVALNVGYAHYNVAGGTYPIGWMYNQVKDHRYQGDAVLFGASYGWHFPITHYFSIELEAGVEGGYTWYERYECKHCGLKNDEGGRWFALPKVAVSLVFPLGGSKGSVERRCPCEEMADTLVAKDTVVVVEVPDTVIVVEEPDTIVIVEVPDTVVVEEVPEEVVDTTSQYQANSQEIKRLRNRLLRKESEYQPYNTDMALSADERNVFLFFDVNVTKMDRSFLSNDRLMDSIMFVIGGALQDSTLRITRIQVVGYASFDGRWAYNKTLAAGRARTIQEHIQTTFGLPDDLFVVCNGEESWAELKYQLQKVEFLGRDEVFAIMDEESDPDTREAKIKRLHGGETYRYMRDELKQILRNLGCITIYYEEIE